MTTIFVYKDGTERPLTKDEMRGASFCALIHFLRESASGELLMSHDDMLLANGSGISIIVSEEGVRFTLVERGAIN